MTQPTTVDLATIPLPAELIQPLARLRDDLLSTARDNLRSLILYGSAARGRWRAGVSDVNLLLILIRAGDAAALDAIAPPLREAARAFAADPFVVQADELHRVAENFPSKFLEMQRYHVMLHGPDVLAELTLPHEAILRRVEQELRNLELRLRRRYVALGDDAALLTALLRDAAVPLSVALLALLELTGKDQLSQRTRAAIFDRAAEVFGLDADVLRRLNALRHQAGDADATEPTTLFDDVLGTVRRAATIPTSLASNSASTTTDDRPKPSTEG